MIAAQGSLDAGNVRPLSSLPRPIREVEHAFIPLADGTRLACRYWLPIDAEERPVPAILEYIPYCKRDGTSARDEAMHPWLAGHGYCAIRVDMRGSGESDGLLDGEYLAQEQDDAVEVIAWLAARPWCSGTVGMFGKSWGGFNSLQVAARRPPALKAIITVCSTDDRYADDIHTMGGCQLLENPSWAFTMLGHNARPPDPLLVGVGWRETWMRRLENNVPWIFEWLRHQRRDAFWKHGSVCEDYAAIACPVFAVGGWLDPYTNPVFRLMEHLDVPRKALIGPWGHQYPHQARPGPAIGFLEESLRWWDRWLKGREAEEKEETEKVAAEDDSAAEAGTADEPMIRAWMHDSAPPAAAREQAPGGWVAEETWPSPRIRERTWHLNPNGLEDGPGPERPLAIASPATVGRTNPIWLKNGDGSPECPLDQRADDAVSLCFDTAPLPKPLAFLGAPIVTLEVASDRPVAQVSVRLSEVRADGAVALVSFGLRNLTHDETHERVTPLVPGKPVTVRFQLNDNAHRFAAGSRIRVAIATGLWPIAWPAPEPVTLTLTTGRSTLTLPVRPDRAEDAALRELPPAACTPLAPRTALRLPTPMVARMEEDLATGELTFVHAEDAGTTRLDENGWTYGNRIRRRFTIRPDDPQSASVELEGEDVYGRAGDLDIRIRTWMRMTSDATSFHVHARLEADEDGRRVFSRTWRESIPRDAV